MVDRQLLTENQYIIQRVGVTYGRCSPCHPSNPPGLQQPPEQRRRPQLTVMHRRQYCHVEFPETFEPTGQSLRQRLNQEYHQSIFHHPGGVSMLSKKRLLGAPEGTIHDAKTWHNAGQYSVVLALQFVLW